MILEFQPQWVNEPSNFKTFSMNATCGLKNPWKTLNDRPSHQKTAPSMGHLVHKIQDLHQ